MFFYVPQSKVIGSPMGKYDSSLTRVAPVFDRLCEMDKTGLSWLSKLLKLPKLSNHLPRKIEDTSPIIEARWGNKEKSLPAPRSLLRWLILNCTSPDAPDLKEDEIAKKRDKLFCSGIPE